MRAAVEHGAAGLEFDLHLSRDRQLVVHHDAVLEVGGVRLAIAETDLVDLRALSPDVAILGDVLAVFSQVPLTVEIKASAAAPLAAGVLASERPPRKVIVTAVDPKSVAGVRRVAPELDTAPGWTVDFAFWALSRVGLAPTNKSDVALQVAVRFDQVEYLKRIPVIRRLRITDRRLVAAAHKRGLRRARLDAQHRGGVRRSARRGRRRDLHRLPKPAHGASEGEGRLLARRAETDGVPMKKRWSDLSERNRRIITVVAIVEAALKAAMLMDLKRRPADQVKGSKKVWALSTIVNSAGIIPLAYFAFGRKRAPKAA